MTSSLAGTAVCELPRPLCFTPLPIYTCAPSPQLYELAPRLTHLTGGETEARGIYIRESSSVSGT